MKKRTVMAADLFCGAGGTSTGLLLACNEIGAQLDLLAINHWNIAIDTHTANHPHAQHLCESLDNVDPRKVVAGGRLNVLVASPECTHHSNARGGRPVSDQSRASAWHILRWAEALYIENIIIENVKEFRSWGPIGVNGRPLKKFKGQTFQSFIDALKSLGYQVEDRVLNAAYYGDPTTRERLFIMARRGGRKITWPEPTHFPAGHAQLFQGEKWRTAREIIDWKLEGNSIFNRKRPLATATLARIEAGLRKFGGKDAEPFLVILRRHADAMSVDGPVPTLTAGGNHVGLAQPFMHSRILRRARGQDPRTHFNRRSAADRHFPRRWCSRRAVHHRQCEHTGANGAQMRPLDKPLATVSTRGQFGLCEPFLVQVNHGDEGNGSRARRAHSVDEPMPTVTTKRGTALIEPFMLGQQSGSVPRSVEQPVPTIATDGAIALIEPFLVKYNGTAKAQHVDEPLDTVTTKDRHGLVDCERDGYRLDIRFRMLQPAELARAQGFEGYEFKGNREAVVKQIGNAVPVNLAKALCREVLQ
jgi:DNA (cytosine-5)-methyltransferase 1